MENSFIKHLFIIKVIMIIKVIKKQPFYYSDFQVPVYCPDMIIKLLNYFTAFMSFMLLMIFEVIIVNLINLY